MRCALVSSLVVLSAFFSTGAEPCAIFPSAETKHAPSLSVEKTLIVFDGAAKTEHFVREAAFDDASSRFGFVVPVPTEPVVTSVAHNPFPDLERGYPVHRRLPAPPGGITLRGLATSDVTVLSREKVGSFTAFVIQSKKGAALKEWLATNRFATTPSNSAWLEHYVSLGFYFAALRYEPESRRTAAGGVRTETVRLTFRTPLPYYPYFEPSCGGAGRSVKDRELAVWLVAERRYVPVSAFAEAGRTSWKRPLEEWNERIEFEPRLLGNDLHPLLRPEATLVLQTFEDQKSCRDGWGDVVFVPEAPVSGAVEHDEVYEKLARALQPSEGGPR